MNIRLAALVALLLAPGQAMAEDVRVDCVTDQRILCRDNETTCYQPHKESGKYHFKFDLTKKTGSLVFCGDAVGCMKPFPLTVIHDDCAALGYGAGCLGVYISVWEPMEKATYTISDSQYIMTVSIISDRGSLSVIEFGHCAVP
jgi:hypothetical protein